MTSLVSLILLLTSLLILIVPHNTLTYDECSNLDGGRWTLVRHIPNGFNRWHKATDNLQGKDEYGGVHYTQLRENYASSHEWSIRWGTAPNELPSQYEFLFSRGDCKVWLITHYVDIFVGNYGNEPKYVHKSYQSPNNGYCSKWFNRANVIDDPLISVGDHPNGMVYAENGWSSSNQNYWPLGGFNVWIRKNGHYNTFNRIKCPNDPYTKCSKLDGGGWTLVRHLPSASNAFFRATDNLQGTDQYGGVLYHEVIDKYNTNYEWSVQWGTHVGAVKSEYEFMFSSGDCLDWMVTHFVDIFMGGFYSNQQQFIHNNSKTLGRKCSRWYNRNHVSDDPLISIDDHPLNVMYAENGWKPPQHSGGYPPWSGRNVWIRHKPDYNSNNRIHCPLTTTTTSTSTTTTTPSLPTTTTTTTTLSPITPCVTPFDIVFVVDGSTSIKSHEFIEQINFIGKVTRNLAENTRVGFILFTTESKIVISLDESIDRSQYHDLNDVSIKIESVSQSVPNDRSKGTTFTDVGLLSAIEMYKKSVTLPIERNRLVFLITDGKPSNNHNPCNPSIREKFDNENIRVFEVGVGDEMPSTTLSLQCLPFDTQNDIFHSESFTPNEFDRVTREFLSVVCPESSQSSQVRRLIQIVEK